ncbi:pathogenesis-related protein 1A-like [Bidens hawaiensis]|uniref:pathogenesis-related protein 1A-like n=1 Tax=Bidens hawaiensis TaxID=980011 RepID=UPI00404AC479
MLTIKEVGVGPLTWNTTVAQYAESQADQRKVNCPVVPPPEEYGENIAIGFEISGLEAISAWLDEKGYYNYSSNSCLPSMMCEHYTQVVWKTSIHIGCARVKCMQSLNDAYYVVCNYHPPGNYNGEKPY